MGAKDNQLTEVLKTPGIRFVERCGPTVIDLLSRSNPWANEGYCPRKSCVPCSTRQWLTMEEENREITKQGGVEVARPSKEDTKALPNCTIEGVGYILECATCRKKGMKRQYVGESSRSPCQRGQEHMAEISNGVISHPLVIHFWEEHAGERQHVPL